jgi:hypothetical protein
MSLMMVPLYTVPPGNCGSLILRLTLWYDPSCPPAAFPSMTCLSVANGVNALWGLISLTEFTTAFCWAIRWVRPTPSALPADTHSSTVADAHTRSIGRRLCYMKIIAPLVGPEDYHKASTQKNLPFSFSKVALKKTQIQHYNFMFLFSYIITLLVVLFKKIVWFILWLICSYVSHLQQILTVIILKVFFKARTVIMLVLKQIHTNYTT